MSISPGDLIGPLYALGILPRKAGPAGPEGESGNSAYEDWLEEGNSGTREEFLESLRGPAGSSGGGLVHDNFIVTSQVLQEHRVFLSNAPQDPLKVSLVIYNGIEQRSGVDFVVEDLELSWSGLALQTLLSLNDAFSVRYVPTTP